MIRSLAKHVGIMAMVPLLGLLGLLALIRTPLLADVDILFYRGTLLCILISAGIVALGLATRRCTALGVESIIAAAALSLSVNLCFLIVIPVTIDRSVSIFLLASIEKNDGELTADDLQTLFVTGYVHDLRQVDRRIREQIRSGNIRIENGKIVMTPSGRAFVRFSRTVADALHIDPQFVRGRQAPDRPTPAPAEHRQPGD
jgi:hypothetical protein